MTRVALLSRHDEIVKDTPNFNKKKFLYYLSRSGYRHEWGTVYRKPGFGTWILAFFLKIVPKVGPFKAVNFKIPTQQTEDMYIKSVNSTVENYSELLQKLKHGDLNLPNRDCDTGRDTSAGDMRYGFDLRPLVGRSFQTQRWTAGVGVASQRPAVLLRSERSHRHPEEQEGLAKGSGGATPLKWPGLQPGFNLPAYP